MPTNNVFKLELNNYNIVIHRLKIELHPILYFFQICSWIRERESDLMRRKSSKDSLSQLQIKEIALRFMPNRNNTRASL